MKSTSGIVCPICSSTATSRLSREGFFQRRVLRIFGYYPWKCGSCGNSFLFRKRGVRQRPQHDEAEAS